MLSAEHSPSFHATQYRAHVGILGESIVVCCCFFVSLAFLLFSLDVGCLCCECVCVSVFVCLSHFIHIFVVDGNVVVTATAAVAGAGIFSCYGQQNVQMHQP